jgi:hypothetical protein
VELYFQSRAVSLLPHMLSWHAKGQFLFLYCFVGISHGSSVIKVIGFVLDNRGSNPSRGNGIYLFSTTSDCLWPALYTHNFFTRGEISKA